MTRANEKVWIANKFTSRIARRALTPFERRNPKMFTTGHSTHSTWSEAHQALLGYRQEALAKAVREIASAERAMAKVISMKEPTL